MIPPLRRVLLATSVFFGLNAVGTTVYWYLSDGKATFVDAVYMAVTTLASVGFGEITPGANTPQGRMFTMCLILSGIITLVFVTTSLTAFFVEGTMGQLLEKRKMEKRLAAMDKHYVVCGAGSTGLPVLRELYQTERPFVFIEESEAHLKTVLAELGNLKPARPPPFAYIQGDASDDTLLEKAQLGKANGLIVTLPNDKDNLYIVVSAKQLNPNARIVARATDMHSIEKLRRAGAHSVVSPNFIGGMRMVSEMVRPSVVSFLDIMLRDKDKNMRVEEATVSKHAGETLASLDVLTRFSCSVLAVKLSAESAFEYNPPPSVVLKAGMTLILLGEASKVSELRAHLT